MTPLLSSTLLRTQSDARLVELAAGGSERAFEAIVERYRRPLLRLSRRVLSESRAEDAVQHAFLKAWSALREGTEVDDPRAWLYRITRNAALDQLKLRGYDYDELSDSLRVGGASDDELERRQVIRDTLAGVASLPDSQREALLRTAVDGSSRAEIARELELSEGAVRQLVHRARNTLRATATAVSPAPLVSWAATVGGEGGGTVAQRVAELVAGASSAGAAGTLVKTGTAVVAAGVLAAGPGNDLRQEVGPRDSRASAAESPERDDTSEDRDNETNGSSASGPGGADRSGRRVGGGDGDRSGRRDGGDAEDRSGPEDDRSGSNSGPGSDSSGPGPGGADPPEIERLDSSGSGSSGSGSSGSGSSGGGDSSGPGSGDGDSSGSGSSGSGSSGSGSSGSGSSGSGSSGSGSSETESSGSGSSGSGSSGSGSSGSGSGSD